MKRTPRWLMVGALAGFSLIEVLIVVIVAGILAAIVGPSIGTVQARLDARGARDAFILFTARARSYAIERGAIATLTVDPDTDVLRLSMGATAVDSVNFMTDYDVDMRADVGAFDVCFSTKGFALASCTDIAAATDLTFSKGPASSIARIEPLGQVRRVD